VDEQILAEQLCAGGGRRILVQGLLLLLHQRHQSWKLLQVVLEIEGAEGAAAVTHVADVLDHFAGSISSIDKQHQNQAVSCPQN